MTDLDTKDEDEDEDENEDENEDEDDDVELKEDIVESVRRGGSSVGMRLESSTVISAMNGIKTQRILRRYISISPSRSTDPTHQLVLRSSWTLAWS